MIILRYEFKGTKIGISKHKLTNFQLNGYHYILSIYDKKISYVNT